LAAIVLVLALWPLLAVVLAVGVTRREHRRWRSWRRTLAMGTANSQRPAEDLELRPTLDRAARSARAGPVLTNRRTVGPVRGRAAPVGA
jgi:ABC-type Fe3+ transport system permease subunit